MRRPRAFTLVAEVAEAQATAEPKAPGILDRPAPNYADPTVGPFPGILGPGILGFIVAEVRRQTGHIITIDVVAEARRSGVGSALLRAAEDHLRESGARAVALETAVNNAAAIQFYKQKGYFVEKTVRGYYSNQLDALVMAKSLAGNRCGRDGELR